MPHYPKPFFKQTRQSWYIEIDRKQYKLGQCSEEEAWDRASELKKKLRANIKVCGESLVALIDAFLEWTQHRRSPDTYEWYRYRVERFARRYPELRASELTPQHVDEWVDSYPELSNGSKRNYIRSIQRVLSWSLRQGIIDRNPIAHMEKPKAGRRERIVRKEEFDDILSRARDDDLRDLLVATWETGCRPQESLVVEARHVDLENARWLFPASEAKTDFPRFVYLTGRAMEITKRRMLRYPSGPLFRNSEGAPWTTEAVNCAFIRIQIRMGLREIQRRGLVIEENEIKELIPKLRPTKLVRGTETAKSVGELREEARRKIRHKVATSLAPKYSLYVLRHTSATRALERGLDALAVAILLGHQDPSMLAKVYQHLSLNPKHLLGEARRAVG
jgi:integrase